MHSLSELEVTDVIYIRTQLVKMRNKELFGSHKYTQILMYITKMIHMPCMV